RHLRLVDAAHPDAASGGRHVRLVDAGGGRGRQVDRVRVRLVDAAGRLGDADVDGQGGLVEASGGHQPVTLVRTHRSRRSSQRLIASNSPPVMVWVTWVTSASIWSVQRAISVAPSRRYTSQVAAVAPSPRP